MGELCSEEAGADYQACERKTGQVLEKCFKFGIEVPSSVKQAYKIDKKNWNTLWADAIKKERENVRVDLRIFDNGKAIPIGYQQVRCHMVFDIKQGGGLPSKGLFGGWWSYHQNTGNGYVCECHVKGISEDCTVIGSTKRCRGEDGRH